MVLSDGATNIDCAREIIGREGLMSIGVMDSGRALSEGEVRWDVAGSARESRTGN
jgi:hypothetical protein